MDDELFVRWQDWRDARVALEVADADEPGYAELERLVEEAAYRYERAAAVSVVEGLIGGPEPV
jgi:hypothetical protein